MYDLKRPCNNCPFRVGNGEKFQLRQDRLFEIGRGEGFQCHKTVDYDVEDDEEPSRGSMPQECAGFMALRHRHEDPTQLMRIAERLGLLDCSQLDPKNEVYKNWREVFKAHANV